MRIILTIKSILNYLYNNLIDLVWVKKIRFEDGTELDSLPTSATLFDIKRRSIDDISDEKLVQKGWCCINESQPKRLTKSQVPTAYEILKDKYNGIDLETTGSPTNIINQSSNCSLDCDDTYLYATSSNWIARRTPLNNLPNFNWENLNIPVLANAIWNSFCVGNNLILSVISSNKIGIYLKSNNTLYKEIDTKNDNNNPVSFSKVVIDNQQILFISYIDTNNNYVLAKIEDSITGNIEILTTSLNGGISSNVVYINDSTFIFCCTNKIYKTTDYFQTYSQVGTNNNGDYRRPCSLYKINNVIVASGDSGYTYGYKISYDNGNTWNSGTTFVNISGVCPKGWCNGKELYVFVHVLSSYQCFLYHTGDLINWERIGTFSYNIGSDLIICADKINNNIFFQLGYTIYNIGFTKVIYTDTINGTDIKYYKNGDWKICTPDIAVGNDTNLQTVYEYLGYLNYWWIDTANEKITLQRDSAFETFMFVGDDYEDSSLPSGSYIPYATKQDCGNAGHTIIYKFVGNSGLTLDTGESLGNSCIIFKNGNKLSIVDDYTINGTVITFLTALIPSDKIEVVFGNITSVDLSQYKQKAQTIEIDDASITIDNVSANTNYVFTSNAITDITLTACETSMEETTIQFTTGNSAPTLTDNSGLVWFGGIPTLLPNTTYVIVIFNGQAFYQEN